MAANENKGTANPKVLRLCRQIIFAHSEMHLI